MVHATVYNLAGKLFERTFEPNSNISDLKKALGAEWGIPPVFQLMHCGPQSVPDSQLLNEAACYQVVVSVEEGCKRMPQLIDNVAAHERLEVLQALAKLAEQGNERAICAAGEFLGDASINVRAEAMRTVATLAQVGDKCAIKVLGYPLGFDAQYNSFNPSDVDFDMVRLEAIKGLTRIGQLDADARKILQKASDITLFSDDRVRKAAAQALSDMRMQVMSRRS